MTTALGDARMAPRSFAVTLSHPVGINRAYRSGINKATGKLQFYATPEYRRWADSAWATCKAAGWPILPAASKLRVDFALTTTKSDIDGGIKAALDVIEHVMGVNDANVLELTGRKFVAPKAQQRLELTVTLMDESTGGEE